MMLSRVADNLYWFGRYIERTEHLCRFLNVQYFSSLETQLDVQYDLVFQSILSMVGIEYDSENLLEEDTLVKVALDDSNQASIKSSVLAARENVRGARDLISNELWQIVNKFYRFIVDFPEDYYRTKGLHDFTQTTIENCALIKHNVQNTLLHDEVWAFIKVGIHLERAVQIIRMSISKLEDVQKLEEMEAPASVISYQMGTLLKSAEAMDMFRKVYRTSPSVNQTLEFLVLNQLFSRSVTYNLAALQQFLLQIRPNKVIVPNSLVWDVGKVTEYLKYSTIADLEKKPIDFLSKTMNYMYNLNNLLTKEYLSY
jgi:uncharacterized alpha-E superfamily protein